MRFNEFGDKNNPIILLIHGYGVSWKMWKPHIEVLQKEYFLIVPALDGLDEENDSNFISVEKSAEDIITYIKMNYEGSIYAICGASLGGTIAFEILAQNRIEVEKAIIDAGPIVPSSKLFLNFSIRVRLRQNRQIRKGNIRAIKQIQNLFTGELSNEIIKTCAQMSEETCRNVQISCFTYQLSSSIQETNTEIAYWYGSKEAFLYKKASKFISELLPNAKIEVFKGYNHGELCMCNPELFVEKANGFFRNEAVQILR